MTLEMSTDGRVVIARKPWLQSAHGIRNTQPIYQGPHLLSRVPNDYAPHGLVTARLKHAGGMNAVGYDPKRMALSNAAGTKSMQYASPCGAQESGSITVINPDNGQPMTVSCDIENPTIPSQYEPGTGTQSELETTYIEATHLADQYQNMGGSFSQASGMINNWANLMNCLMLSIGALENPTAIPPVITNPQPDCATQPAQCPSSYGEIFVENTSTDSNCTTCVDQGCLNALQTQAAAFQGTLDQILSTTAIDFNSAQKSNPDVLQTPITSKKIRQFLIENPNIADQVNLLENDAVGNSTNLTVVLQFIDSLLIEWVRNLVTHQLQEFLSGLSLDANTSATDWVSSLGVSTDNALTMIYDVRKNMWNIVYSTNSSSATVNQLQTDFNAWISGFVDGSLQPFPSASFGTGSTAIVPSLYQTIDPTGWNPMGARWLYLAFKALMLISVMVNDASLITETYPPSWVLQNREFNASDIATIPSAWTQGIWNGSSVCFPSAGTQCQSNTFYFSDYVEKQPWSTLTPAQKDVLPWKPLGWTVEQKGKYILWGGVALLIGYSLVARYGFPQVTA